VLITADLTFNLSSALIVPLLNVLFKTAVSFVLSFVTFNPTVQLLTVPLLTVPLITV
jgi:hypothetical protein